MPDPTNPADLPASWLPGATAAPPRPPAYLAAVARTRKNRRHALVLAMATKIEDDIRAVARAGNAEMAAALTRSLEDAPPRWWKIAAEAVGHPSSKPPSPETRAAVIEKVRADLAAPYRAKGRG